MIQVGDWVDICWATDANPVRALVQHTPQGVGDSWHLCTKEGLELVLNLYAPTVESLQKVEGPDA